MQSDDLLLRGEMSLFSPTDLSNHNIMG